MQASIMIGKFLDFSICD